VKALTSDSDMEKEEDRQPTEMPESGKLET